MARAPGYVCEGPHVRGNNLVSTYFFCVPSADEALKMSAFWKGERKNLTVNLKIVVNPSFRVHM